jgi:hypothetical protein
LKGNLQSKEEEITHLKNNAKISKYQNLENDYISKLEEYVSIKNSYDMLRENFSM